MRSSCTAGFKGAATSAAVHRACVATFTIGHAALEGEVMPEPPILSLVQALTLPTKLKQLSTTLSPKLTPKCDRTNLLQSVSMQT
jgi:hypothetical protein